MPLEGKLAVIGLGLVGGSILRGALARGLAAEVQGWDGLPAALGAAREAGFGRFLAPDPRAACRGATLAVVAVPVCGIPALVDRARRLVSPTGGVVTDTGSTKRWVRAEVERLARLSRPAAPAAAPGGSAEPLPPFVGGHPIAGVERSGFGAAREDLFEGQSWVLTFPEGGPERSAAGLAALERVSAFARGLGAEPCVTTAAEHDRALAATSHLPYLLAASLAALAEAAVGEGDLQAGVAGGATAPPEDAAGRVAPFAAGGFRDSTRLALQDPGMGLDMLATNTEEIERVLTGLVATARRFLDGASGRGGRPGFDGPAVLERARAFRAELGRLKRWR